MGGKRSNSFMTKIEKKEKRWNYYQEKFGEGRVFYCNDVSDKYSVTLKFKW
jgi:hypothetical protein